jgi:hypothetical protein
MNEDSNLDSALNPPKPPKAPLKPSELAIRRFRAKRIFLSWTPAWEAAQTPAEAVRASLDFIDGGKK